LTSKVADSLIGNPVQVAETLERQTFMEYKQYEEQNTSNGDSNIQWTVEETQEPEGVGKLTGRAGRNASARASLSRISAGLSCLA